MTVPVSRPIAAVLAVAAVVVLAGCGVFLEADASLPSGEEAVERFDSLDSYNATYVIEMTEGNETERWTGTRTISPSTGQFYERFTPPDGNTTIGVNNGSVSWLYDTKADTVTKYSADRDLIGSSQLRQLINSAQSDDSENTPVVPINPSFLLAGQSGDDVVRVGPKEVSYEGIGTVAGREAHIIEVTATGADDDSFYRRHYLDTEWFVQLKFVSNIETENEDVEIEMEMTDVEYEPELPEGIFQFTPPDHATVQQSPIQTISYDSRAELDSAVSFSIPDPNPPEGFQFSQARHAVSNTSTGDRSTGAYIEIVSLEYRSDRASFVVEKTNTSYERNESEGEQVTVAGQPGQYQQTAGQTQVTWRCDGHLYAVTGELTRGTLLTVAKSVGCE